VRGAYEGDAALADGARRLHVAGVAEFINDDAARIVVGEGFKHERSLVLA
jgi:hypothetical protein